MSRLQAASRIRGRDCPHRRDGCGNRSAPALSSVFRNRRVPLAPATAHPRRARHKRCDRPSRRRDRAQRCPTHRPPSWRAGHCSKDGHSAWSLASRSNISRHRSVSRDLSMALWFETALLPAGWAKDVRVEIAHGRIARVETGVQASPQDERHAIAIPGLCNVHSHGFQRGMAGLAEVRGPEGDNFWTWREVMYRFLDRLNPEQIEAITAQAYVEMLESGFTRVGEFHYLHRDPSGAPYANMGELAERIV